MPSLIFNYLDPAWRTHVFSCACGWRGTWDQGWSEDYEMLMDMSCPGEHGF